MNERKTLTPVKPWCIILDKSDCDQTHDRKLFFSQHSIDYARAFELGCSAGYHRLPPTLNPYDFETDHWSWSSWDRAWDFSTSFHIPSSYKAFTRA